MRGLVIAIAIVWSSAALAQQNVSLTMTIPEAQTTLNALAEKPWKDINPLMQKLIVQINEQTKPKSEAKPEPKATPEAKDDHAH